jgi:xylulokinase
MSTLKNGTDASREKLARELREKKKKIKTLEKSVEALRQTEEALRESERNVSAILEGSAFGLRDILDAMRSAGLGVQRLVIVGGGAKGPLWRQIKADVTGLPVRVPVSVETTATGAAILAAVAAGVHGSVTDAVAAFVAYRPEEHQPDAVAGEAYDEAYRRYRDVYAALKPVFAKG